MRANDLTIDNKKLLVENEDQCLLEEPSELTNLIKTDSFETQEGMIIEENHAILLRELEQPWPSTFERAISLLASPKISVSEAELFTRSPQPGAAPATIYLRESLRRRRQSFDEQTFASVAMSLQYSRGLRHSSSERFTDPEMKAHLADKLASIHRDQENRQRIAKKYRECVLSKEGKRDVPANTSPSRDPDGWTSSPGYGREQYALRVVKLKYERQTTNSLQQSKSSFLQCVFNLANILMGVGLLGLPYAVSRAGWFGGILCLTLFGLVAWRTSVLIGRLLNGDNRPINYLSVQGLSEGGELAIKTEERLLPQLQSFPGIARAALGEAGCLFLSVVLYFELFSCICIFFVSIGDHMHTLFPKISRTTHVLLVGFISLGPTIVLRTPSLLSYLSMVGTFATLAVCLSVVLSAMAEGDITQQVAQRYPLADNNVRPNHELWNSSGITVALGLVAYCFSEHAIVPSIYSSMRNPGEFEKMCTVSFSIVMVCCLAVGASGYYMFGALVKDQVTLSLQENAPAGGIMSVLTGLMVMTAFSKITLTMFPLALGLEEIISPHITSQLWVNLCSSFIKIILTALALFIATCIPSFSTLCELVGLVCTMIVSVIFPAAAYLRLFWPNLSWYEIVVNVGFVIFGLVIAVVGTVRTCWNR